MLVESPKRGDRQNWDEPDLPELWPKCDILAARPSRCGNVYEVGGTLLHFFCRPPIRYRFVTAAIGRKADVADIAE
jgi:hypothetical protein